MDIFKLYAAISRRTHFRQRRMQLFANLFRPNMSTRIVDIGGTLSNWTFLDVKPQVRLVNLDRLQDRPDYPPNIRFQRADALHLPFKNNSFDIAYSNSVIEHVSTWDNQQLFAREVSRVAPRVWVQTPAREFFLEPHLLTPFIHWLPHRWRRRLIRHFTVWGRVTKPSRARVDDFLSEVRLLSKDEMPQLFPDCSIYVEKWMGLTKGYVAYRL